MNQKETSIYDSRKPQSQEDPEKIKRKLKPLNTFGDKIHHTSPQDDAPIDLIRKRNLAKSKSDNMYSADQNELSKIELKRTFLLVLRFLENSPVFLGPIVILYHIIIPIFSNPNDIDAAMMTIATINIFGFFITIFFARWLFTWVIFEKLPKHLVGNLVTKKYSLNRKTGMVTLYGGGEYVAYSHPFVEFDCRMFEVNDSSGSTKFNVVLCHRYSDFSQPINIGDLIDSARSDDQKRLWNVIQQYMDVSQPLPDLPFLEPFRSEDQTTAAYDKEIGRDPNYWRSMSFRGLDKTIIKMAKNQKHIPPLGKPINIYAQTLEELYTVQ
ncbi:hypothetical protein [Vibrio nigripulchritudo]|uniref:hypothetical protein n=1 Tax=Vibrio nigripulchritudo TaxID=28173 RepID=UPI0003B1817D|nr:hypothetical protein [Vibrio nigripulchritudo]CCN69886.1 hypothetical protein VIBNISFn118_1550001 [Vibrio nigripulchritudo SFn118]